MLTQQIAVKKSKNKRAPLFGPARLRASRTHAPHDFHGTDIGTGGIDLQRRAAGVPFWGDLFKPSSSSSSSLTGISMKVFLTRSPGNPMSPDHPGAGVDSPALDDWLVAAGDRDVGTPAWDSNIAHTSHNALCPHSHDMHLKNMLRTGLVHMRCLRECLRGCLCVSWSCRVGPVVPVRLKIQVKVKILLLPLAS